MRREQIYEALYDDEAFARLPQLLARAVGGRSAIFQWIHHDGDFETLAYSFFTPDVMRAYGEVWAPTDPWVEAGVRPNRLNDLFSFDQSVPTSIFEKTQIYNDFLRPDGDDTYYGMGGAFSTPWGTGVFGVHRGRTSVAFTDAEVEHLRGYVKDIGKVLRVRGEVAAARRKVEIATGMLDTVALAMMTVLRNGRLLDVNSIASNVLSRADGLIARGGVLMARSHTDALRLAQAISQATNPAAPSASSVAIERGPDDSPYLVTIAPFTRESHDRIGMVVFRDPDMEDQSLVRRLRSLFGLTNAEADIAIDLSRGQSTTHIAARRGVGLNTLKTQLASVMTKTRCSRQSEVAALVAALPPINGLPLA